MGRFERRFWFPGTDAAVERDGHRRKAARRHGTAIDGAAGGGHDVPARVDQRPRAAQAGGKMGPPAEPLGFGYAGIGPYRAGSNDAPERQESDAAALAAGPRRCSPHRRLASRVARPGLAALAHEVGVTLRKAAPVRRADRDLIGLSDCAEFGLVVPAVGPQVARGLMLDVAMAEIPAARAFAGGGAALGYAVASHES